MRKCAIFIEASKRLSIFVKVSNIEKVCVRVCGVCVCVCVRVKKDLICRSSKTKIAHIKYKNQNQYSDPSQKFFTKAK